MSRLRYNGLTATLGADLLATATAVTFNGPLAHAAGDVPTLTTGDYIPLTLVDTEGEVLEIVHLTAYTTGTSTGTISRGEEDTTDQDHTSGTKLLNGPTRLDFTTRSINVQTGTAYTLDLGDAGGFLTMDNAAASILTVPPNSSVAFPVGTVIEGAQLGVGQVTLTPGIGVTINATPGLKVASRYGTFALIKTATDTWLALGRLAA